MLTLLQDDKTTIRHTFYICDMLMNCKQMFHKSFIDSFFLRLADAVETKVNKKSTQKDLTNYDVYDRLGKVLSRLMLPKEWALRKSRNLLELGI